MCRNNKTIWVTSVVLGWYICKCNRSLISGVIVRPGTTLRYQFRARRRQVKQNLAAWKLELFRGRARGRQRERESDSCWPRPTDGLGCAMICTAAPLKMPPASQPVSQTGSQPEVVDVQERGQREFRVSGQRSWSTATARKRRGVIKREKEA